MNKIPSYIEPISKSLRRRPQGKESQIVVTLRWAAIASLCIFLTLIIVQLTKDNYRIALVISIGILPIIVSLFLMRQGQISFPSILLAVNMILLITYLTTDGNGIYDIGILGYPAILIVTGLILRGKVVAFLAGMIILCLGWLVFGDILGLYEPAYPAKSYAEDFFIASTIILQ